MIEKLINIVGCGGIAFAVWIFLYALSMRCVAKEDETHLPWKHAWWYAFHDTFFWARKLRWIEDPSNEKA